MRRASAVSLTFFEYNALAALLIFEAAQLDAWVLEIGMGGRLDAVNVVDPAVAVVVSIGLDHQEFLGPTLECIAREKAGIFRARRAGGARQPRDAAGARRASRRRSARRSSAWASNTTSPGTPTAGSYRGPRWDLPDLPPPALLGDTQFRNAAAAIAALEELAPRLPRAGRGGRSWAAPRSHLVGRFQVIARWRGRPTWILDVAHNPDAAAVLARAICARCRLPGERSRCAEYWPTRMRPAVALQLRDCIDEWWLCPTEGAARHQRRGAGGADCAAARGSAQSNATTIAGRLRRGIGGRAPGDRIVVFGSFHTVGPALDWLEAHGVLSPPDLPEYTAPPNDHE